MALKVDELNASFARCGIDGDRKEHRQLSVRVEVHGVDKKLSRRVELAREDVGVGHMKPRRATEYAREEPVRRRDR